MGSYLFLCDPIKIRDALIMSSKWSMISIDSIAKKVCKWYQQCDKMMIKRTETQDYMVNVLYVIDVLPSKKGKQDKM